jgi:hypothetical protein
MAIARASFNRRPGTRSSDLRIGGCGRARGQHRAGEGGGKAGIDRPLYGALLGRLKDGDSLVVRKVDRAWTFHPLKPLIAPRHMRLAATQP